MSNAKIFLVCLVWLFVLLVGVLAYKWFYVPSKERQKEEEQQAVIDATSGTSNYKHRIRLGLDGFSGYAILRSEPFQQQLRSRSIKLELVDDSADYEARIAAIQKGELQMAAFPIDALLKVSEGKKTPPATIIAIVDETRGADAVVGYKERFPNVDALNDSNVRFVLVGNSPSETLTRVLMHNFQLDAVSNASLEAVDSEQELLDKYRQSSPTGDQVFVTWEPNVSTLLQNDQLGVLFDTSSQSGFIVDALVVSRDFLAKNEAVVGEVLEAYFRALYSFDSEADLVDLVQADAKAGGIDLTDAEASALTKGIVWKNTQENFAHFGLRQATLPHVEDMIDRIKTVLLETDGLNSDPTSGNAKLFFYEQALADLQSSGFHPGVSEETVREDDALKPLSDAQWNQLEIVGEVKVEDLVFGRGSSRLIEKSKRTLDELITSLESFPRYYVVVRGNASKRGDAEANKLLAQQRADSALKYLTQNGLPAARVRTVEGELTGKTSVSFVVGQLPY